MSKRSPCRTCHVSPPPFPFPLWPLTTWTPLVSTITWLDQVEWTLEPSGLTARFLVNTQRVLFVRVYLIWPTTSIDFPSVIVIVVGCYYLHASNCRISLIFETTCFIRAARNPQMIKKSWLRSNRFIDWAFKQLYAWQSCQKTFKGVLNRLNEKSEFYIQFLNFTLLFENIFKRFIGKDWDSRQRWLYWWTLQPFSETWRDNFIAKVILEGSQ